jgi:hypothetical protein
MKKGTRPATRGCRAAFHRWRTRRFEVDRLSPSGNVARETAGTSRFPARQYAVNREHRSFALLPPIADVVMIERSELAGDVALIDARHSTLHVLQRSDKEQGLQES